MDLPNRKRLPHEIPQWVNEGSFFSISSYVLMNPVRWGLCERPEDWPWIFRPRDR